MTKLNYKQQLEKLAELQLKVEKSRDELAHKIGRYVVNEYKQITTLNEFKKFLKGLERQNNSHH